MYKYFFFLFLLFSCGQREKNFETEDWFEANILVSSKPLYKEERLQILVNGKRYYGINGDTTEHAIFKFLKIPEPINEITVVIQGDKLLTSKKSFKTVLGEKRYKIIVSPPYPRTFDCLPYPYQPEWYQLPLDSIKRDVTIKPDTSKNNVIL